MFDCIYQLKEIFNNHLIELSEKNIAIKALKVSVS